MKKIVIALLLALCFCLAAACSAGQLVQDMNEANESTAEAQPTAEAPAEPAEDAQQPELPDVDDSGTDLYMPGEPGFVDDSGTDAQTAPSQTEDWTALSAAECVEDAWPEPGVLPRIVLACEGADQINEQLQSQFASVADDPMCEGLSYECYKGLDRVLTVLMIERGPNDTVFYTPFRLDLVTGEALTGEQLLALIGADATELSNLEQAVLGEEFTHLYGLAETQTDPDFFNEQYERTTSPENAELERIWLGEDGQIYFVGRVYAMAGAECYEYPVGSTMYFG